MKKLNYILILLVFSLFFTPVINYAQIKISILKNPIYANSKVTDKNNIEIYFNNLGKVYSPQTQSGSHWLIRQDNNEIVFDQSPWIVGKKNGEIVVSGGMWLTNYSPGPIINGQAAMLIHPEDSLRYRVYKINKGDDNSNPDYAEWPVDFGAPVNNQGQPLISGDQVLWACFNYLDSNITYPFSPYIKTDPLEVEIHQTVYLREGNQSDLQDIFSNVIFLEYEIIYKGSEPIESAYFGLWSDIDFEPMWNNKPAVDIDLQTSYCWSSENTNTGDSPFAVGYSLLYGPVAEDQGSTAIFKGKSLPGYKNLPLTSFHGIGTDYPPDTSFGYIHSLDDAWNYARGLNKNGNPYIDPTTSQQTAFPLSGDPVTNTGWLYPYPGTSVEAGVMFFSGPFTLAQNDTQWTMIALVPGLGNTNLHSISNMREKVQILRSLSYDSLAFGNTPYAITDIDEHNLAEIPQSYQLYQNYPNPFNPNTKIKYSIPQTDNPLLGGAKGGFVTLKVYDVLGNEVATLVNEYKPAGNYEVEFNGHSDKGQDLSSGVYFYTLRAGNFVQTKKMILLR